VPYNLANCYKDLTVLYERPAKKKDEYIKLKVEEA
jgi:hypothetical protein